MKFMGQNSCKNFENKIKQRQSKKYLHPRPNDILSEIVYNNGFVYDYIKFFSFRFMYWYRVEAHFSTNLPF